MPTTARVPDASPDRPLPMQGDVTAGPVQSLPQRRKGARLRRLVRPYTLWNQVCNIDTRLRYEVADRLLNDIPSDGLCEVGGGNAGIGHYRGERVIGVDIAFDPDVLSAANSHVNAVTGTCTALPFADRSFDAVLSIDSLEHVPRDGRAAAVRELVRIARRRVVLSVPCGEAAAASDRRLLDHYSARHGSAGFWLTEHVQHEIPTEIEVLDMFKAACDAAGTRFTIRMEWHMPIRVHDFNQRTLMIANYRFARPLSAPLRLLQPLLRSLPSRGQYRCYFIVDRGASA